MGRGSFNGIAVFCRARAATPVLVLAILLTAFLPAPSLGFCPWSSVRETYPVVAPPEYARISTAKLVGYLARFGLNSAKMIDQMHEDHGPVVIVEPPPFPLSLLNRHSVMFIRDRDLAIKVLGETEGKARNFERDPRASQGGANIYGPDNVFFAHGADWAAHRKALSKSFGIMNIDTPSTYGALHASIEEPLRDLENRIRAAGGKLEIDLEKELEAMAVKMTVEGLYGKQITLDETHALVGSIDQVNRWFVRDTLLNVAKIPLSKLPRWLPGVARAQDSNRHMASVAQSIFELGPDQGVLNSAFANTTLTPAQQKNNVQVILGGATEASTSYFTWVMHDLLWHPEQMAKVQAEIDSTLGGKPILPGQPLPRFQTSTLESMRLHTPFFIMPRRANQDAQIEFDGTVIGVPKGTHLVFSAYSYHRSESDWGVEKTGYPATVYAPDRLFAMGSDPAKTLLGFGFGPRVCLGRHAAEAEKDVLISRLLQRFSMKPLGTGHEVDITSTMATHPKGGLRVEIQIREGGR